MLEVKELGNEIPALRGAQPQQLRASTRGAALPVRGGTRSRGSRAGRHQAPLGPETALPAHPRPLAPAPAPSPHPTVSPSLLPSPHPHQVPVHPSPTLTPPGTPSPATVLLAQGSGHPGAGCQDGSQLQKFPPVIRTKLVLVPSDELSPVYKLAHLLELEDLAPIPVQAVKIHCLGMRGQLLCNRG